jgi:hypothetical protein
VDIPMVTAPIVSPHRETNAASAMMHVRICVLGDHTTHSTHIPNPDTLRNVCVGLMRDNILVSHQIHVPSALSAMELRLFERYYIHFETAVTQMVADERRRVATALAEFVSSSSDNDSLSSSSSLSEGEITRGVHDLVLRGPVEDDSGSSDSESSSVDSEAEEAEYQALKAQAYKLARIDPLGHLKLAAAIYAPVFVGESMIVKYAQAPPSADPSDLTSHRITSRIATNAVSILCDAHARAASDAAFYFVEVHPSFAFYNYCNAQPIRVTPASADATAE